MQLERTPHGEDCVSAASQAQLATATAGFSGAECVSIVREAALAALTTDITATAITLSQLIEAAQRVKPQITPDMLAFYAAFAKSSGHGRQQTRK
jgi:SpoVK/Ycf46/Vps4 family AAA+-type ATPase